MFPCYQPHQPQSLLWFRKFFVDFAYSTSDQGKQRTSFFFFIASGTTPSLLIYCLFTSSLLHHSSLKLVSHLLRVQSKQPFFVFLLPLVCLISSTWPNTEEDNNSGRVEETVVVGRSVCLLLGTYPFYPFHYCSAMCTTTTIISSLPFLLHLFYIYHHLLQNAFFHFRSPLIEHLLLFWWWQAREEPFTPVDLSRFKEKVTLEGGLFIFYWLFLYPSSSTFSIKSYRHRHLLKWHVASLIR